MSPPKKEKQIKEWFSDCLNKILEEENKPSKLLNDLPT